MNIADRLCLKPWVSHGAVAHTDRAKKKLPFYSKYGMIFTATKSSYSPAYDGKIDVSTDGTHAGVQSYHPDNTVNAKIKFKINQANTPVIDPITNAPLVKFPDNYVRKFEDLDFIEYGPNCLVGGPLLIEVDENGAKVSKAVSFVVELHDNGTETVMLQRARWSDGYMSVYCCSRQA